MGFKIAELVCSAASSALSRRHNLPEHIDTPLLQLQTGQYLLLPNIQT